MPAQNLVQYLLSGFPASRSLPSSFKDSTDGQLGRLFILHSDSLFPLFMRARHVHVQSWNTSARQVCLGVTASKHGEYVYLRAQ